ncbi:hypothetical protein ACFLXI_03475 [Chloroflexota bacterium]
MARRSRKKRRTAQPKQEVETPDKSELQPKRVDLEQSIDEIAEAALQIVQEEDKDEIEIVEVPQDISNEDLLTLYKKAEEARQLFDAQKKKLKEVQKDLDVQLQELKSREEEFLAEQEKVEAEKRELIEDQDRLAEQQQSVDQKTIELDERELNAKSGFLKQHEEVQLQANKMLDEAQKQLDHLMGEIFQQRQTATENLATELRERLEKEEQRWQELRNQQETYLAEQGNRLETEWDDLHQHRLILETEQKQVTRDRRLLEVDLQNYQEDRESLDQLVRKIARKETENLQAKFDFAVTRWKELEVERNDLRESLIAWDSIKRNIGKNGQEILQEIERLTKESNAFKEQLADQPDEREIQKLRELLIQQESWEDERYQMGQQISELRNKLHKARMGVIEYENLRTENLVLDASRKLLLDQVNELRQDVEGRVDQSRDVSPFPQCFAFDLDYEMQNTPPTEEIRDLSQFADEVRNRIASQGLFYEARDIRSFIGGLAMSRTIILQGISGTGKTSLPSTFADAAGGFCEVIEVQAGWRDRDDLIGYYNAFENKFHEKKFLQALYQAGCPLYEDRIFILLLDEMNLSYVEQYFADFLSVLQMPKVEDHRIDLIPAKLPDRKYPGLFTNDQRSIPIPKNVWFVGTANQDETTRDIADKTYDRSHVLELPNQYEQFEFPSPTASPPIISHKSLENAFDRVKQNNKLRGEADKAWKFLEVLRPTFGEFLNVGWGNRLKGQIESYLPVTRTCNGSWNEAVDDILSMKVLRKIRDRYEVRTTDLERLLDDMNIAWKESGQKSNLENGLERSSRIIRTEIKKKTGRLDEASA